MNWRKGFFRSWVLFSVFWVVGVGIATYQDGLQPYPAAGVAAIGVPAALLALGAMIAWVFRGFRKEQA